MLSVQVVVTKGKDIILPPRESINGWRQHNNLMVAVEGGDIEKAQALIKEGANINRTIISIQRTPLCTAIYNNYIEMVGYLLAQGASPNQPTSGAYYRICLTARHNQIEMIKLLTAYGADINQMDNGRKVSEFSGASYVVCF